MRYVEFAPLARRVSAIGLGCASLGSRVDGKTGTEALVRAYDAGVSWFDVAPSYGDGHAEVLLGRFLTGRRSQVSVCTKVGVLPCHAPLASRVARPVVRSMVGLFPRLRKHVAKLRPPAQRVELTGSFIESSIAESLKRLQTDHVDVLGLHEPNVADVQRDDVLRALDNVVRKGYARTVSLAGDAQVALAAVALSERISIIQIENSPFSPNVALTKNQIPAGRSVGFITHGVYGHDGPLDTLTTMISTDANKRSLMNSAGYRDAPRNAAASFLLDFALSSNLDGVTLLSMYKARHFVFNIGRLTAMPPPEVVLELASGLMSTETRLADEMRLVS